MKYLFLFLSFVAAKKKRKEIQLQLLPRHKVWPQLESECVSLNVESRLVAMWVVTVTGCATCHSGRGRGRGRGSGRGKEEGAKPPRHPPRTRTSGK
jgi:hypothetical protein